MKNTMQLNVDTTQRCGVEGVFSDEHVDYPQGTWVRNPHLSLHQSFSREGCLNLVKMGHLLNV